MADEEGDRKHGKTQRPILDWRYHIPGKDDTLARKDHSSVAKGSNWGMLEQAATDRIVVVSRDAHRFASARHTHQQAQLIYAIGGVVSVTTADGTWIVPPSRAVWVPAGIAHETKSHAAVQFRALLIDPAEVRGLPGACTVVEVTPLLRELILRLAALTETPTDADFGCAVTRLLLLELSFLPVEPLTCRLLNTRNSRAFANGYKATQPAPSLWKKPPARFI